MAGQAEYGRIETSGNLIQFLAFSNNPDVAVIAIQNKEYHAAGRLFILLDRLARKALRAAVQKYETWRKITQGKLTRSSKPLSTLELAQLSYQNGRWHDEGALDISIVVASRSDVGANQKGFLNAQPSAVVGTSSIVADIRSRQRRSE